MYATMNFNGVVANNKKFCSWTGSDSLPLQLPLLSVSEEHTICQHATILNGMCVVCDKLMDDSYGVCFDYIEKGLRYSIDEISRLKKRNTKNLLRMRKLHLVLDLDHTLLHSRWIGKLTSDEKYLEKAAAAAGEFSSDKISRGNDLFKIKIGDNVLLVKLRPFVRSFLEEASRLFEISVCTMGNREYATRAVKLLDPDCKYFNSRIITREDFKQKERKYLDLVLGQENSIVIVDDTESVWGGRVENLITVGSYDFFKGKKKNDCKSYSEQMSDESESDGALANILRALKAVHALYFDNPGNHAAGRDVRSCLAKIRSRILMGCTILFGDDDFEELPLTWSRAEEMGAICTLVTDASITHVVSSNTQSETFEWAEQENKCLVHPQWINDAYFLWCRQPNDVSFF